MVCATCEKKLTKVRFCCGPGHKSGPGHKWCGTVVGSLGGEDPCGTCTTLITACGRSKALWVGMFAMHGYWCGLVQACQPFF